MNLSQAQRKPQTLKERTVQGRRNILGPAGVRYCVMSMLLFDGSAKHGCLDGEALLSVENLGSRWRGRGHWLFVRHGTRVGSDSLIATSKKIPHTPYSTIACWPIE
jgi:hypothetical protein